MNAIRPAQFPLDPKTGGSMSQDDILGLSRMSIGQLKYKRLMDFLFVVSLLLFLFALEFVFSTVVGSNSEHRVLFWIAAFSFQIWMPKYFDRLPKIQWLPKPFPDLRPTSEYHFNQLKTLKSHPLVQTYQSNVDQSRRALTNFEVDMLACYLRRTSTPD